MPRFLLPPRPLVAPANLSPLTVALAPRRQGSYGSPFKGLFLKQASQTRPADKNLHNGWYLYVSYLLGAKGTSLIFFLPSPTLLFSSLILFGYLSTILGVGFPQPCIAQAPRAGLWPALYLSTQARSSPQTESVTFALCPFVFSSVSQRW